MKDTLTIAIPAYNEEGTIREIVLSARPFATEILVVNDGSTDKTLQHIPKFPNVRIITHKTNLGFSGAIRTCYREAKGDLVFLLPADGQVNPGDVRLFLDKITDCDVVVGYRTINPEHVLRKINSRIFHALFRLLFGVPLKEISTSILWRKKVLDGITITAHPKSALVEPEVIYKAWRGGWKFAQVGIPFYKRTRGAAKGANPIMILLTMRELIRLWWQLRINTSQ